MMGSFKKLANKASAVTDFCGMFIKKSFETFPARLENALKEFSVINKLLIKHLSIELLWILLLFISAGKSVLGS